MGKYYCDYCDVYLTHDSASVRKQHNDGNRHRQNVSDYYKKLMTEHLQLRIDALVADFERRVAMGLVIPTYGLAEAPVTRYDQTALGNYYSQAAVRDMPAFPVGGDISAFNAPSPADGALAPTIVQAAPLVTYPPGVPQPPQGLHTMPHAP